MSTLNELAKQLQVIATTLAAIDGGELPDGPADGNDINVLFPRLGAGGAKRERFTANLSGVDYESIREYEIEVANEPKTIFSVAIGSPGSSMGMIMALNNGARVRFVSATGEELTPWLHRAEARTYSEGSPGFGDLWPRQGQQSNAAYVNPGDTIVLQVKGGRRTNAAGDLTLTYSSIGPRD